MPSPELQPLAQIVCFAREIAREASDTALSDEEFSERLGNALDRMGLELGVVELAVTCRQAAQAVHQKQRQAS
ncbi:MAG: hypothetical protein HRU17_01985 [Polyangiaceae bacterium]|nr:hypothetical protein [Polyangiaceae bacterium]